MKRFKPHSKKLPIEIESSERKRNPGTISVQHWEGKDRTWRALILTAKILSRVLLLCMVAIFVHPLIIPSVVTLTISVVGSPILFSYFLDQKATFLYGEGHCPHCPFKGKLKPFLWRTLKERVTLLCPECGQTCHASVKGWENLTL